MRLRGAVALGALALSLATLPVLALSAAARAAVPVPPLSGLVVDRAGVLSPALRPELEASLRQFQAQRGPQIALLTIPSLEGESIEGYSIRVVDQWKLGDARRDDGVLLLVVPGDRQVRIEVGQGLEGDLPDAIANRIVADVITPRFRQGQLEAGIMAGLQAIAGRLGGELAAPASARAYGAPDSRPGRVGAGLFPLLLFLFFVLPLFRGRRYGYGRSRGGLLTGFLLGNLLGGGRRRGGWGGGGGFGGGFGGGGGGGFSGGGASGRW
jgi:uncharacterized protein